MRTLGKWNHMYKDTLFEYETYCPNCGQIYISHANRIKPVGGIIDCENCAYRFEVRFRNDDIIAVIL